MSQLRMIYEGLNVGTDVVKGALGGGVAGTLLFREGTWRTAGLSAVGGGLGSLFKVLLDRFAPELNPEYAIRELVLRNAGRFLPSSIRQDSQSPLLDVGNIIKSPVQAVNEVVQSVGQAAAAVVGAGGAAAAAVVGAGGIADAANPWTRYQDDASGAYYWYNSDTDEFSWEDDPFAR